MASHPFEAVVEMAHPPERVFAYLADPRNRPEWQGSLVSVTMTDRGEPHLGMTWRETTMVGIKPRMEIVEFAPYKAWAETGRWRGVSAELRLRFTSIAGGTRVRADGAIAGEGIWAAPAAGVGKLATLGIRSDLQRADRILAQRPR